MSPETWFLEDQFPFEMVSFQVILSGEVSIEIVSVLCSLQQESWPIHWNLWDLATLLKVLNVTHTKKSEFPEIKMTTVNIKREPFQEAKFHFISHQRFNPVVSPFFHSYLSGHWIKKFNWITTIKYFLVWWLNHPFQGICSSIFLHHFPKLFVVKHPNNKKKRWNHVDYIWAVETKPTIVTWTITTLWFWGFWGSLAPHLVGKYIIPGSLCSLCCAASLLAVNLPWLVVRSKGNSGKVTTQQN